MTNTVLLETNDAIATITINRPESMNTFNKEMADDLVEVTKQVQDNKNIRAVLLRGSGPLFMAGGDISFFYQRLEQMPAGVHEIIQQLDASILALRQMDKPVLAAVHGSVAGAGISIMLAADLVIAAKDTAFTLAYTGIGTSPDGGASYFLPRLVGTKKAMELMMLSDRFDAKTALDLGLINWLEESDNVFAKAEKIVQRLSVGPTQAYSKVKKLVTASWNNDLQAQFDLEAQYFAHSTTTKDFKSGVTAFVEKTKPQFVGE